MSCERCERDIERLRGELNILRSEMIEVVGGMLVRVDEVLATVETSHRQMFADLRAQADAWLCAPARRASTHRPELTARTTSHRN
jgi:hypothetical protein